MRDFACNDGKAGSAMLRITLTILTMFVALLNGAGCMSCRHNGFHESLHTCEVNQYPTPIRQQVYLFMMNGSDSLELGGMLTLRDKLCHAGYAKVYYAQQEDRNWFHREIRRLQRDEPQARILLLGYGTAAERTMVLACDAVRDGVMIDAVIFLDPVAVGGNIAETLPIQTVAIRSHNWTAAPGLITNHTVQLPTGHYSAPTHPGTVQAIAQLMTQSASRVKLETIDGLPHLPLRDKQEPTPRGIDPSTLGPNEPDWNFLRQGWRQPVSENLLIPAVSVSQ